MTDPTPTPFIGENTLAYLLTLIVQDFAKKSELPTDTTYAISIDGDVITLTGSDSNKTTVTLPKQVVDSAITFNSENPVKSNAIYTALADKPSIAAMNAAIAAAIAGVTQIDFQIVDSLPVTGTKGVIYLVANTGSGTNSYDEFIYTDYRYVPTDDIDTVTNPGKVYYSESNGEYSSVGNDSEGYSEVNPKASGWFERTGSQGFERLGTTDVDLTGYWNSSNLSEMSNQEALAIWTSVMNPSQLQGE